MNGKLFVLFGTGRGDSVYEQNAFFTKQEAHGSLWSPGYQRLYTDYLSEGLIFIYQQPYHRINNNQQWQTKAAILPVNTIGINRHIIKTVFLCLIEPSPKVEKFF